MDKIRILEFILIRKGKRKKEKRKERERKEERKEKKVYPT